MILFTAIFNLLKFATPLYLLQVLDRIPVSRSIETLAMLTVMALVAVGAGLALDIVRRRMLSRWGIWIERRFGPMLVGRELDTPGNRPAADIRRSLGDLGRIRTFIVGSAASWLDLFWAPIFLLGIWLIHPMLGAVAVGATLLLAVMAILQDWVNRDSRRASSSASQEAGDLVLDAERYRESVGALSMSRSLTERWQRSSHGQLDERERIDARHNIFRSLIRGLGEVLRIAVIAVGIWLMIHGELTLGGIFAARVMAGFSFGLVQRAAQNWRPLREARTAYANLKQKLIDDETQTSVLPGTADAPLVFDKVTFRHPGQRDDLYRRLEFTLARGEALLVTGTAATGKTTFSRLVVGLLEPKFGQVRLGDVEVARLPVDVREGLVGYLPQHTELFACSVRENIARMGDVPLEQVVEAAKLAGIHDVIVSLSEGYDTPVATGTPGTAGGLSGSERKRIALARAILGKPRLIVLDEPMANLDEPSRRALGLTLRRLKEEGCSIIATQSVHSTPLVRMADKFIVLGAGGTPEVTRQPPEKAKSSNSKVKLRSVT